MKTIQLPNSVASPQDLASLLTEVRECAKWFAHETVKKKVSDKATRSASPTLSPAASELLKEWGKTEPMSQKSLTKLIELLEDYRDKAPSITITLAAPAGGGTKKTLVSWCRKNIADNVLVSFQFNSTLLGGMVVRSGSQVFDWSFRRQLLAKRDSFPEVLRHVR